MSEIKLNGITYIAEAIADTEAPAHDYDAIVDVEGQEDLNSWFSRLETEWPDLPDEIKHKIIDNTESIIKDLAGKFEAPVEEGIDPNMIMEEGVVEAPEQGLKFYGNGTWYGNEIELADGSQIQTSELLKGRLPVSVFTTTTLPRTYTAHVVLGDKIGRKVGLKSPEASPARMEGSDNLDEATDSMGNELYDFAKGRLKFANADKETIEYNHSDLTKVIPAQESMRRAGHSTPKLGYYWDEYWTLMDEVARRRKRGEEFDLKPWSLNGVPVDEDSACADLGK